MRDKLKLLRLGKSFGSTRVLHDVSFDILPGEVHLLAGENGAGKSTLIKILSGVYTEYDGAIELDGKRVRFASPHDANQQGVAVIHQEMSLVNAMSVAENIFLGREPARCAGWWLDRSTQLARAAEICGQLDLELSADDLARPVDEFSLSVRNRIEIAKALSSNARVLLMDEPTSALNQQEVEKFFRLIESLKARGCGILYITHKMEEIYRIADRITVLRDGRWIGTASKNDCPPNKLLYWMIGREMDQQFPPRQRIARGSEPPALEVKNLRVPNRVGERPDAVAKVSFHVQRREIVGLVGLQGSGNSELLHGLFGAYGPVCAGEVYLKQEPFVASDPRESIRRGLAFLTGDRKSTGLVLNMSVEHNVTLAALPQLSPGGLLRPRWEREAAERHVRAMRVRLASPQQSVGTLSGGNQQKIALAKWVETKPTVMLLEEPTRGVDVGAKHEIYELMNSWIADGRAILMISSELPELLGLCDRILVLHRGAISAEFDRGEFSPEKILAAAMGASEQPEGPK